MHKFALIATSSVGALFTTLVAVPRLDAMAFNYMASAEFLASSDYAAKPEHVRRCRARDCRSRYYEPPAYYWGWGWRTWPYYPYYNFGTGQSHFSFAH
jgi:hypothetical protein